MAKPNHPPFSDWIQSGEPLTPAQSQSLQEHLRSCPECSQVQSALFEVQLLFRQAGMFGPAAGFSGRWQQRLAAQRARQQRRNTWILFILSSLLATVTLSVAAYPLVKVFLTPALLLSTLVYWWTYALVTLDSLRAWLVGLAGVLPSLSAVGLIFFIGFNSLMIVLWWATYRQLTTGRRYAQ